MNIGMLWNELNLEIKIQQCIDDTAAEFLSGFLPRKNQAKISTCYA